MSLRFLIPILLIALTLLITLIGYGLIRSDLTAVIEKESTNYMNIELSKLQALLEPLLIKKDVLAIKSLQASKASELDNKAMLVVNENGEIVASNNQQDLLKHWKTSRYNLSSNDVTKIITAKKSHTLFSNNREELNGYTSLCTHDVSKGLNNFSCGFLYYQLDMNYRQKNARVWLFKQSIYIALGSSLAALLLLIVLHLKITRRVLNIKDTLNLWSKGDRSAQVILSGKDELVDIANMINSLVTQFSEDEESLIFNQQVNDAIIQSTNYSIIATDTQGTITTFNSSAEKLLGYDKSELINKESPVIFHKISEVITRNDALSKELGANIEAGFETFVTQARHGITEENNWTYIHKNGDQIPVRLSVSAIYDPHGHISGFLGIAFDISEQLEAEEKLEQLAYIDQLTQLPNRLLYNDRLNQTIALSERQKKHFSIFFLDLDKFKFVNDNFGHEVGDKLLVYVAQVLTLCIRKSDTVARLGGDEFTVILPGLDSHYDKIAVGLIAEKIIDKLSEDILIDGHTLHIGASIGIAIYPQHGEDAISLIKNADTAMYQAKESGRGQCCFYNEE